MKSRILPLLLLGPFYSVAQDTSFQLKDYKYRTPTFQSLSINLNLSASTSSQKEGIIKNSNNSFSLGPSQVLYTKIISTDKRLHQTNLYITQSIYSKNNKTGDKELTSNKRTVTSFGWERSDRFYKPNLTFFEVGNHLVASIDSRRTKDTLH